MNKNKESCGIYNVTFNDKTATSIKTDLEKIEYGIVQCLAQKAILYSKGYHNIKADSGFGAEHIKLHLSEEAEGAITIAELLNLGESIREYLKEFKEPFIEPSGRKVYEWQNRQGVRFRTVVGVVKREGPDVPLSSLDGEIITFYSDRNLKEKMQFKNPQDENEKPKEQEQSLKNQHIKPKNKNKSKSNNFKMGI